MFIVYFVAVLFSVSTSFSAVISSMGFGGGVVRATICIYKQLITLAYWTERKKIAERRNPTCINRQTDAAQV